MIRRIVFVGAALLATCAIAAAQDQATQKPHHHKAAEAAKPEVTPSADVPLPAVAQKWFGDTVDGILSGADATLNGVADPKK